MIKKIIVPIMVVALVGLVLAFHPVERDSIKKIDPASSGFAVVELFTSEGCSSCPPADALIAKIEKESSDKSIYILAYHVDYWDRLGWKDTFSDAKFSARQNRYANWLNLKSVYTPQIVVNGSQEFVGSNEGTLRKSLVSELARPSNQRLEIALEKADANNINLSYKTKQKTNGYNLVVSVVSPMATNKILRGENQGRTLAHVQIVRELESIALKGDTSGSASIKLAKISPNDDFEIIAFLQNNANGRIIAASGLNISQIKN